MNKRLENFIWDVLMFVVSTFIIGLAAFLIMGCSPRYVTVPEYHYENIHTVDTFLQRDSILKENNTIIREADSAMLSELGIRLKDGERAILVLRKELERVFNQQREVVRDTVIKVDSIRVPYPVEKKLTKWQTFQIKVGSIVLFLVVAVGLFWLLLWLRRKRNNR